MPSGTVSTHPLSLTHSPVIRSDYWDSDFGTERDFCDYEGVDLESYGCDCAGCDCDPATPPPTPSDATECYTLQMIDSASNGWNGVWWTWRAEGEDGQLLKTGTLPSGATGTDTLCTYASIPCYEFVVDPGGDSQANNIWWKIVTEDGLTLWEGGAEIYLPTTVSTCTTSPTTTPVPTSTAHPTGTRIIVDSSGALGAAAYSAASGDTIVLARDIQRTSTLQFTTGLTDLTIKSDTPGTKLKGDGTFRLIYIAGNELTLENLHLTGGYAGQEDVYGGAIFALDAKIHARLCVFSGNSASVAGAVIIIESTAVFEDCEFKDNEATAGDGGAA